MFAHVSWQLWPERLFAKPEELPGVRRRFRRSALTLTVLIGAGLVLGAAADALR